MKTYLKPALLISFYVLIAGGLLRRFPPLNPDEVVVAVASDNYVHGRGTDYSLYDTIFAPSAYALRGITTQESRILYAVWVGLWTRGLPRTLPHLRWSTLSFGAAALFAFYALGRSFRGPPFGLLCVFIVLANPIFWAMSCVTTEHTPLLCAAAGIMALAFGTGAFRWKTFILGVIGGVSLGFHPNILIFFSGFAVFYTLRTTDDPRWRILGLLAAGFLAGAILAMAPVDLQRYLQFQKTLYWQFAQPPILSRPWTPVLWVRSTLTTCFLGPTYYFNSVGRGWRCALAAFWLASGICLAALNKDRSPTAQGLGFGLLTALVVMTLLLKRQEMAYVLILLPFLVPLIALGWETLPPVGRGFTGLLYTAGMLCFALFVFRYAPQGKSLEEVRRDIQAVVPEKGLKMAGPNFLWFLYPDEQIRDVGAVINSRYYTGGESDLRGWLSAWKPDILFVSPLFRRVYLGRDPGEPALRRLLGVSEVNALGTIMTLDSYGTYEIYRIRWSPPVNVK